MATRNGWYGGWGRASAVLLGAIGALASGSCSEDAAPRAGTAEGCSINSDCDGDLICAFRRCHLQCNTDRDCPSSARCMLSDKPQHVCQLSDEIACTGGRDCPGTQICGVDGSCRDGCGADGDCIQGQVCAAGACAMTSELVGGALPHAEGGAVAPTCTYTTDCEAPLVCRAGACRYECLGDRDCAPRDRCVQNTCQPREGIVPDASAGSGGAPPIDAGSGGGGSGGGGSGGGGSGGGGSGGTPTDAGVTPCLYNSECAAGQLCRAGRCLPECVADADCRDGESCDPGGKCVPVVPTGAPAGYGASCTYTSECTGGLVCSAAGLCRWECQTALDCPGGCCSALHTCITGSICSSDAGPPPPPVDAGSGADCAGDLDCQDGDVCNGFERCVTGRCRAATKTACDDENPCTRDDCDATTGACTHTPTGPMDHDGDQHYAVACGGGADDCDDDDPTVYKGHAEVCDQVDNNCDGRVDEGVWNAEVPVTLPGIAASVYPGGLAETHLGPPAIVRLSDGSFIVAAVTSTQPYAAHVWKLDSSLAVVSGPTSILGTGDPSSAAALRPTLATNGTHFALGLFEQLILGNCNYRGIARAAVGTSPTALTPVEVMTKDGSACTSWPNAVLGTSPVGVWNGSTYLLAWADQRDGTRRAWLSSLSAGGALGGAHLPLVDPLESLSWNGGASTNGYGRVTLAAGATSALVAYHHWDGVIGWKVRTVLMDQNLGAVLAGPVDLEANGMVPSGLSVAHVGSSFLVAASWSGVTYLKVIRLDDRTGAKLSETTVENVVGWGDPVLVPVAGGVMLGTARDTSVSFGWAPEDVARGGFAMRDVYSGTPVSSGSTVAIDVKHAALAWQDGAVKVAKLVCGP